MFNRQITTPKDFGHEMPEDFSYDIFYYAGYSVFFSGLSVGLTNIASGLVYLEFLSAARFYLAYAAAFFMPLGLPLAWQAAVVR